MNGLRLSRQTTAFPTLDEAMIERLFPFGDVERAEAGAALSTRRERASEFFVVLEGVVALFDIGGDREKPLATLARGQFTGDFNLVSGRMLSTFGRALRSAELLRIGRSRFRELVVRKSEIAEAIMRAFIYRRIARHDDVLDGSDQGRADAIVARGIRLSLREADK